MEGLYWRWTFTWKSQSILFYIGCSCRLETLLPSHHKSRCPNPVGIILHFPNTTVSLKILNAKILCRILSCNFLEGNLLFRQKSKSICQYKNPNAKNSSAVEFRSPWGLYEFNCGDISLGCVRIPHFCYGCIHIVISCSYISLLHANVFLWSVH